MSTTRNTGAPALTARSVLASVLLGTDPPWLPTRLLVRTAELFGIADGTARVGPVPHGRRRRGGGRGRRLPPRRSARRAPGPPAGQPTSGDPARGTALGSWPPSTATAAGPLRRGPRLRDALPAAPPGRAARGGVGPARQPRTRPLPGRRARWSAEWCHRWRGARPEPEPDVGGAVGPRRLAVHMPRSCATDMARLLAPARGRRHAARWPRASSRRPRSCATSRPTRCSRPSSSPTDWPGEQLRRDYDRYDAAYRAVLVEWFAE